MNKAIPSSSLNKSISTPIDLFITCASFEDRCLSASFELPIDKIESATIFYMEEFADHSSDNKSKLLDYFGDKGRDFPLSNHNPRSTADCIFKTLHGKVENNNLLIDITTFTRESLLILLKALYDTKSLFNECQLIYTCATQISENLSYDLVEIRTILGYIGEMKPTVPLHLIILAGFEYERARQVIDAYEPDFISIGYGGEDESVADHLHELNIKFKSKLASIYENDVVFEFAHSLVDPFVTKNRLAEIVRNRVKCNTVIVPLNTKISTVGAGLLAIEQPELQICYTEMANYNFNNYSQASNQFYIFKLWAES